MVISNQAWMKNLENNCFVVSLLKQNASKLDSSGNKIPKLGSLQRKMIMF